MHELSMTKNILDVALEHAEGKNIINVHLLMGEFSDEREEAIVFYWNDLVKGTTAENAKLTFQKMDAEMKCLDCGTVFHPEEDVSLCPACESHRLKLLRGDEVKLDSIEVE
jgi:hydrogenase nickel incorporation protein HypA/HybF